MTMHEWGQKDMSATIDDTQIEMQAKLEEALKETRKIIDTLQNDRVVSEKTLHETFTL